MATPQTEHIGASPEALSEVTTRELEQLRELLLLPETLGLEQVRRDLTKLEGRLADPRALTSLLVPVIVEVLRAKIADSGEAVAKALAPVIDAAIRERTEENKEAISAVIGPLVADAIRSEIKISPKDVADALAPVTSRSIARQHEVAPEVVSNDLAPVIGGAIKKQITTEREAIVDALYPVIGSTIAKYMSETLNELVRKVNERLEHTLSVDGVLRKIRARVYGVKEAELLLQESVGCQVRAVFLIHKSSGLVIVQRQHPEHEVLDSDLLSGMLTAIRSFFNDSFLHGRNDSELDQIEYGRSKIILEVAGYCYLAAVVDGEPRRAFIEQLRDAFSSIVHEHGELFKKFEGDRSSVPSQLNTSLDALINLDGSDVRSKKSPKTVLVLLGIVMLAIVIPWGISKYRDSADRKKEELVRASLGETTLFQPGTVTVNIERELGTISGIVPNEYLRKKAESAVLAVDSTLVIKNVIVTQPGSSLTSLVEANIEALVEAVNRTKGIAIKAEYNSGNLVISGSAPDDVSVAQIEMAFTNLRGISSIANNISVADPLAHRIYFGFGSFRIDPDDQSTLHSIAAYLKANPTLHVRAIGQSDALGNRSYNMRLAQQRSEAVVMALRSAGVPATQLEAVRSETLPGHGEIPEMLRYVRFEKLSPEISSRK